MRVYGKKRSSLPCDGMRPCAYLQLVSFSGTRASSLRMVSAGHELADRTHALPPAGNAMKTATGSSDLRSHGRMARSGNPLLFERSSPAFKRFLPVFVLHKKRSAGMADRCACRSGESRSRAHAIPHLPLWRFDRSDRLSQPRLADFTHRSWNKMRLFGPKGSRRAGKVLSSLMKWSYPPSSDFIQQIGPPPLPSSTLRAQATAPPARRSGSFLRADGAEKHKFFMRTIWAVMPLILRFASPRDRWISYPRPADR